MFLPQSLPLSTCPYFLYPRGDDLWGSVLLVNEPRLPRVDHAPPTKFGAGVDGDCSVCEIRLCYFRVHALSVLLVLSASI